MLSVSGLHLWRGDRHVLRGVSFAANPGQCVLLTGKNGAGKTTLLRAIAGLLDPEEGEVSWRGAPARKTRDEFHGELAYLGHEPPLKGDLSARENLRFSIGIRRDVTREEIDAALARTGATDFADRSTRMLSAGQRRRVALAGVLLSGAVLWLLDEPTTNLDADGQRLVASLIEEQIARGGIVVAAVHHELTLSAGEVVGLDLGVA
ncbi:MAG TPA: cytochrome c biogenesis heme-transporting ATPase CcmA [Steroidobacteraceae bacterium]|jgi:heme exporter protein A|nr:cytochrome c biogenesis heme-transporting ATPase CcmA [Steroidobacteraceae bacterium]